MDIFAPVTPAGPSGNNAEADDMSLIGESDLGFEAEVLGIRRGRNTGQEVVDTNALRERFQVACDDAESLMTFGGDGGDSPTKNEDEEEEPLISFD